MNSDTLILEQSTGFLFSLDLLGKMFDVIIIINSQMT